MTSAALAPAPAEPPLYPRMKATMDAHGNWITQPHMLWRDEKGWHDRPVTETALESRSTSPPTGTRKFPRAKERTST